MRYHEPITIFPRRLPSGRVVWYYRAYDPSQPDNRTGARSTGATTKTAARAYCRELQKQSEPIPEPGGPRFGPPTFAAFARDFWTWDKSPYIEARLRFSDPQRPAVSRRHADDMASALRRHIMPVFGRRRLDSVTPTHVKTFALRLRDGGLAGKTTNNVVSGLRTILAETHRAGLALGVVSLGWWASGTRRKDGKAMERREESALVSTLSWWTGVARRKSDDDTNAGWSN